MIDEAFKRIQEEFLHVEKLKKAVTKDKDKLDEEDKSEEFLNSFYDHATKSLKLIEDKINQIDKEYEGIMVLFGDTAKKYPLIEKFIPCFKLLHTQLNEALKKYKEMKEKKEKAEKKKKKKK